MNAIHPHQAVQRPGRILAGISSGFGTRSALRGILVASAESMRRQLVTGRTLLLIALTSLRLPFSVLGLFNRGCGRPLRSVFVCYPGRSLYSRRYVADWAARFARWRLFPIGLMRQPGGLGLVFATSSTERDFLPRAAKPQLEAFVRRVDRIAAALGCATVSMSGVLPSACLRHGVGSMRCQAARSVRTTAEIAFRAVRDVAASNGIAPAAPLVVLGGHGAVGKRLVAACRAQGRPFVVWDVQEGSTDRALDPDTPVILVDVSRPGALRTVAEYLPHGSVVLSDVYPEPSTATIEHLEGLDIDVYHLAGVEARIVPSLPGAYRDVVPCCAAIDGLRSTPVVRRMSGSAA